MLSVITPSSIILKTNRNDDYKFVGRQAQFLDEHRQSLVFQKLGRRNVCGMPKLEVRAD
jgi:hypothetical protein